MVKFLKQSEIVISYWKNLKDLDYISIRNCIRRLDIRYRRWFSIRKNECIGKPKELWKALKPLGLPKKISSCEMSAQKVNKTVPCDTNLVLGGFKDYYSNLARNLLKKLPKPPNKFTLNTVFHHDKGFSV